MIRRKNIIESICDLKNMDGVDLHIIINATLDVELSRGGYGIVRCGHYKV